MTIGFVLGNGKSREEVLLNRLAPRGKIYGCNGLYRDFKPSVLVATDKPIATAIQESGYARKNLFFTRNPISGLGARPVPPQYYGFSSGPIAAAIAAAENDVVFLIGFDLGGVTKKFNNVYADTEFYKKSTDPATPGDNWSRQLTKIATDYPKVQFVRVIVPNVSKQIPFNHLPNFETLPLKTFFKLLNTL